MASSASWPADAARAVAGAGPRWTGSTLPGLVGVAGGLALLSLLSPSQPGYDAWAWLLWGREAAGLNLDTTAGPAFKPLCVAVTTILSLAGDAAPQLWLLVARTGALTAVGLAAVCAQRLSGGSRVAAVAAAVGVAASSGFPWHAAVGNAEGLFLALSLAAFERASANRHGTALVLGLAAGLLRPEAWLFIASHGIWIWFRRPQLRPLLGLGAAGLLAAWMLPEWIASGDPLRSSERARIPNPGAPALAERPAWESLRRAAQIPLVPALAALPMLALGPRGTRLRAATPALAGAAWIAVVAAMAELGYSGEPRYALPGAALLAVSAGAAAGAIARRLGDSRAGLGVAAVAMMAAAPFLLARADGLAGELRRAEADARLYGSLATAIERAGGAAALRACGRPVVGAYRGPAAAWALGVHRREIAFAGGGGVALRSRLHVGGPLRPRVPSDLPLLSRSDRWELRGNCPSSVRSTTLPST